MDFVSMKRWSFWAGQAEGQNLNNGEFTKGSAILQRRSGTLISMYILAW